MPSLSAQLEILCDLLGGLVFFQTGFEFLLIEAGNGPCLGQNM
jgi:hypothetical protein